MVIDQYSHRSQAHALAHARSAGPRHQGTAADKAADPEFIDGHDVPGVSFPKTESNCSPEDVAKKLSPSVLPIESAVEDVPELRASEQVRGVEPTTCTNVLVHLQNFTFHFL